MFYWPKRLAVVALGLLIVGGVLGDTFELSSDPLWKFLETTGVVLFFTGYLMAFLAAVATVQAFTLQRRARSTGEAPAQSPYRWPRRTTLAFACLCALSLAWTLATPAPQANLAEQGKCSLANPSGIMQQARDTEVSGFVSYEVRDGGLAGFPPGRVCELYGHATLPLRTLAEPAWADEGALLATSRNPSPGGYFFLVLLVLSPTAVTFALHQLRRWKNGSSQLSTAA